MKINARKPRGEIRMEWARSEFPATVGQLDQTECLGRGVDAEGQIRPHSHTGRRRYRVLMVEECRMRREAVPAGRGRVRLAVPVGEDRRRGGGR